MTLEQAARAFATANPTDNGADWAGLCGVLAYRMCLEYGTPPSSVPATAKAAGDAAGTLNTNPALAPIGAFHYWDYGTDGHVGLEVGGGGSKVFMASTYISEVLAPDLGFQTVSIYTRPPTFTYRGWSLNYGVNGRITNSENLTSPSAALIWGELRPAGNVDKIWSFSAANLEGSRIFAVSANIFYYSLDRGITWATVTLPVVVASMAWAETLQNLVIAATSNAGVIYYSHDYGITWTATSTGVATDGKLYQASRNGNIFIYSDSYIGGGNERKSLDGGITWPAMGNHVSYPRTFALDPSGNFLYISGENYGGDNARKSINQGSTWTVAPVLRNRVSISNAGAFILGATISLKYSLDYGVTFNAFALPGYNAFITSDDAALMLVANGPLLYSSLDKGITRTLETPLVGNTSPWENLSITSDGNIITAATAQRLFISFAVPISIPLVPSLFIYDKIGLI